MQVDQANRNNGGEEYDAMALATRWQGPAIAFNLASPYIFPGQTILDLGIGTGLSAKLYLKHGLRVIGLDISHEMLEFCRKKCFASEFVCHDLNITPYPFDSESCDHVISTGVFQFFKDLEVIFREVNRVHKNGGMFIFITGDRRPDEPAEVIVEPDLTGMNVPITMYRHPIDLITCWLEKSGFLLVKNMDLVVYMDKDRLKTFPARAYLAKKTGTGK